ncbi:MAG: hypothetical protein HY835_08980 [Anaerolineae bacterium]|nr:hypothetical protein [Anaerolineae bacterium]
MGCSIGLGAVFSALLVAWFVVWLIKARPGLILAAVAAVSLMLVVTPFGWAYEQVWLVFPIVLITGNFRNRWPFLVSSMLFLIISMVSLALLLVAMHQQMDVVSFLVPLLVFILTTLSGSQKNTITNPATV